jgi:hypothetical protein
VTLGFALPSFAAYLKVGGNVNSLLPLTIGGAVVLARLSSEVARHAGGGAALVSTLAAWMAVTVTPPNEPPSATERANVRALHHEAVAAIRREVALGHRTLYLGGTAAWIDAGERSVPRDSLQIANEMALGRQPWLEAHYGRIAHGAYDTVIVGPGVFDGSDLLYVPRLRAVLAEHFESEPPRAGTSVTVYHRVR